MDALACLLDTVGLDVRHGHEVVSSAPDWTLDLGARDGYVWVAPRRTTVWVRSGCEYDVVRAGSALLVRAADDPVSVSTGPDHHEPPHGSLSDPFDATGVHHGTATFGPLASEALQLPETLRTRPLDALSDDVLRALDHLGSVTAAHRAAAHRDSLARTVVLTVLRDEQPAFLVDGSLTWCIDTLFTAEQSRATGDIVAATLRCSRRTAERRFRESTGRTPDELRRWYRSLQVRRALLDGEEEHLVANRFGFATVGSLRRALDRARPPRPPEPRDPLAL